MATIDVQLSIYPGSDLINSDRIETSLEVLNERCQIVRKTMLRYGKPTTLDLELGEYLFRTYFPSGELVAQRVDVRTEELLSTIYITPDQSPHEWLAWPYFIGSEHFQAERAREAPSTETFSVDPWHQVTSLQNLRLWNRDRSSSLWQEMTDNTFNWIGRTDLNSQYLSSLLQPDMSMERQYLVQVKQKDSVSRSIMLPPTSRIQLTFFATHFNERQEVDEFDIQVLGLRPVAEMLLRYLDQGAFEQARRLADSVIHFSPESHNEPPLPEDFDTEDALVVGYYLERNKLFEELNTLVQQFFSQDTWLPDGLILRAWNLLYQTQGNALAEVRDIFLQTVASGFPVYKQGVRLLIDGLEIYLDRTSDQAVEQAYRHVRQYAAVLDWEQQLTTLKIDDLNTFAWGGGQGIILSPHDQGATLSPQNTKRHTQTQNPVPKQIQIQIRGT